MDDVKIITEWSEPSPIKHGDFVEIRYNDYRFSVVSTDGNQVTPPVVVKKSGMVLRVSYMDKLESVNIELYGADDDQTTTVVSFMTSAPFSIRVRSSIDDCE